MLLPEVCQFLTLNCSAIQGAPQQCAANGNSASLSRRTSPGSTRDPKGDLGSAKSRCYTPSHWVSNRRCAARRGGTLREQNQERQTSMLPRESPSPSDKANRLSRDRQSRR